MGKDGGSGPVRIDESIPYYDVIMVRPAGPMPALPRLPAGYAYRTYRPGDQAQWSRIETAVGEFATEADAGAYFARAFLPEEAVLPARMAFIEGPDGWAVADAAAWWAEDEVLGRVARLHWVAVHPAAQGLGLGRAVSIQAMRLFETAGPAGDIWLTMQTWSHAAIGLYLKMGFRAHRSMRLGGESNGFDGAAGVLDGVMPGALYRLFIETAVG